MAVLETLYLLFKSDTKDAQKGINEVNESLKTFKRQIVQAGIATFGLMSIFKNVSDTFDYFTNLNLVSQTLGVSTEKLDEWAGALVKTGGSIDSFKGSLQNLSEKFNIAPERILKLLPMLADSFHRMNQFQALRYGKMLGLDEGTILLLQQGRRELQALLDRQKELGIITKEDALAFGKFRFELSNTGRGFRTIFETLAIMAIPILTKVMQKFQDFAIHIKEHSGLIKGALLPLIAAFGVLAVTMIAANLPFYLMIAGLAALSAAFGLAYDDLETYRKGGKSVIGELKSRWPELTKIIVESFHEIHKGIIKTLELFDKFTSYVQKFTGSGNKKKLTALEIFKDMTIIGALDSTEELLENFRKGHTYLNSAKYSAFSSLPNTNSLGGGILKNSEQNINIGTITINTQATNAEQVAYGFENELRKHLRQTQNNAANGRLI